MADGGWWLPDPTGRCDYRFRRVDGTYTDQVTNGGVPLIDPWEVATVNRRPTEPWPAGASYCWRCKRGAVAGEEKCTRCGGMLTSSLIQEAAAARGRRSSRKAVIWCAVVFGGIFALFGFAAIAPGGAPGSSLSARVACQQFLERKLRAPATADFTDSATVSGNTYTVRGFVDSQNGFGAKIRTTYECAVIYNPDGGSYTVTGYLNEP